MAATQSPLRRWKRFFPAFAAIDAAVEAVHPAGHLRDEFRSVRGGIVELLCDAEDDGVAEELCLALDDAMAESLVTLRVAPVTSSVLASTDLAKSVAALGGHESARIRSLARDVVRGWRATAKADLARATAAMEVLDRLSDDEQIPHRSLSSVVAGNARSCIVSVGAEEDEKKRQAPPTKTASVGSNRFKTANSNGAVKAAALLPDKSAPVGSAGRANAAKMGAATKAPQTPTKKMPPVVGNGGGDRFGSDMMEATKRKLREGYQEVEDAKRRRKIQVIEAPKVQDQRQRKEDARSRARRGSFTGARRSLVSSLQRG